MMERRFPLRQQRSLNEIIEAAPNIYGQKFQTLFLVPACVVPPGVAGARSVRGVRPARAARATSTSRTATEAAAEDEPAAEAPRRLDSHSGAHLALDLIEALVERAVDCDHDQCETDTDTEDADQEGRAQR